MLIRSSIFALLTGLTALACQLSPAVKEGVSAGVIMQLPGTLEGFHSRHAEPDSFERRMLPDDTEFAKAVYFTPTTDTSRRDVAFCSIVLSGAERRSIHRPEVCLVGQGWTLLGSHIIPVDLGNGRTLSVKNLYIEKSVPFKSGRSQTVRAHYIYWFVGADVTTPSHVRRIWLTLRDNVMRNINHRWAYPSVMALVTEDLAPADSGERPRSSGETLEMLSGLIRQLAPKFQKEFME